MTTLTVRFDVSADFPHHLERAAYDWLDQHGFKGAYALDMSVKRDYYTPELTFDWAFETRIVRPTWVAKVAATTMPSDATN